MKIGLRHRIAILILCAALPTVSFASTPQAFARDVQARLMEQIRRKLPRGARNGALYYFTIFSYQDAFNRAENAHTFATYARAEANRKIHLSTISWFPASIYEKPLCVFDGPGSIIFPHANGCRPEAGKNLSLKQTLELGAKRKVAQWGPYEIRAGFYAHALKRIEGLKSGKTMYMADDRLVRKSDTAINCVHAVSDMDRQIPMGGFLNSGLYSWGFMGTKRALSYLKKIHARDWFIDVPQIKKDFQPLNF